MGIGQLGQMSKMPISPNVYLSQSSHAFNAICPKQAYHLTQASICPKCSFAPIAQRCPFALVLIFPGAHFPPMSIRPNVHRSQMPTCLKCRFALVLIFPSAHFSPLPTCPNAQRSQSAHLVQSAHLPQIAYSFALVLIFLGAHFTQVPIFSPNAHLPQCSSVPKCLFSQTLICPSPHMLISPKHVPFAQGYMTI